MKILYFFKFMHGPLFLALNDVFLYNYRADNLEIFCNLHFRSRSCNFQKLHYKFLQLAMLYHTQWNELNAFSCQNRFLHLTNISTFTDKIWRTQLNFVKFESCKATHRLYFCRPPGFIKLVKNGTLTVLLLIRT